jgi:hypothetical protein
VWINHRYNRYIFHIHTYHSRLIPEGVSEVSQIFLRDAHTFYLNDLAMRNTADVRGGKPFAVWLQSTISFQILPYFCSFISFQIMTLPYLMNHHFLNLPTKWCRYHMFSPYCDKDSANLVLRPTSLTSTILWNGVGANDCICNQDQLVNMPSEALRSSR